MIDIKQAIEKELAARNKACEECEVLAAGLQTAKKDLEDAQAKLSELIVQSDKILKAGGNLRKITDQIREAKLVIETLSDRVARISYQDENGKPAGLIEDARIAESRARDKLAQVVERALQEPRRLVADEMSKHFAAGMDCFDEYNNLCEALFRELDVQLHAGTLSLAPLPSCPGLHQLLENGFLHGSSVPTPLVPISAPFGTPEPVQAAVRQEN